MDLRPELMPPVLDGVLVDRLAKLAASIDGARPGEWEDELAEFNRLADTDFPFGDFQGISGGMDHAEWVRRVLYHETIRPAPGVTREELVEVVLRCLPQNGYWEQRDAWMAIFDANVPRPRASNLIFYPPDYDESTNTWGGGRKMGEYEPTPEQIVDWALGFEQG